MFNKLRLAVALALAACSFVATPAVAAPASWSASAPSFKLGTNEIDTRAEAISSAKHYAENNCPRPGTSSTRRCLDVAVMSDPNWYSPGAWDVEIAVWECWKIDPACKDRRSARRGASRDIRIWLNGSVTTRSGWREFP